MKRGRGRPKKDAVVDQNVNTRSGATEAVATATVPPTTAPEYSPDKPLIQMLSYDDGTTPVFKPTKVRPQDAKFKLPPPRPDSNNIDAVIKALTSVYLPDRYIMHVYKSTLAYIAKRQLHPRDVYKLLPRDIFHFFAILYYFGYCRLPSKVDYWKPGDNILGDHPICTAHGMTHRKFQFIWRNIYLMKPREVVNEDDSDDEGELESLSEHEDEYYVVRSEDDDFHFDEKARSIIDQCNWGNKTICHWPSHVMTIDEQMVRFKGRSKETYRMDNKPITCGYKCFSIVDVITKFLWHMLPYGRRSTKSGTILTVKWLVETLPKRNEKFYVVGMDNYFTHVGALRHCLNAGVHAMGTARGKRGWPAPEIRRITDGRFNTLYHLVSHENDYVTYRWVDNNVVTLVSTLHDPNHTVVKDRRRPRTTQVNKRHIARVWGDDYVKPIAIPAVVDDYNHWKTGVDAFDQLIAYLICDVRCRRTWMPLMIQVLNTMRVNSYIGHKGICGPCARDHKDFTLRWIKALMRRAVTFVRHTRDSIIRESQSPSSSSTKRYRMSNKNPRLPESRCDSSVSHVAVLAPTQGKCIYCRYLYMRNKLQHPDADPQTWGTIAQPQRKCIGCNQYLCKRCFDPYHDPHVDC